MKETRTYKANKAYILANDEIAKEVLQKDVVEDFMKNRHKESFIFVAYHVKESIVLLHMKKIK